jgi:uncharacterized protein
LRLRGLSVVSVVGRQVPVADRFWSRLLGLTLLDREQAGCGLYIPSCSSIHTFGMRFALDLHFVDRDLAVLATRRSVLPGRIITHRGAAGVVELPSHQAE